MNLSCRLDTADDVRNLRLVFLARLLASFDPGAATLEICSGVERISDVVSDALIDAVSFERLPGWVSERPSYAQVVWFNGLNWARPAHATAIAALRDRLTSSGRLYVSCASHFQFLGESPSIEWAVASEVRAAAGLALSQDDFGDRRFGVDELRRLFFGYRIKHFEHVEVDMQLGREAFVEWHGGSSACLFGSSTPNRPDLVEAYLNSLFERYRRGTYQPRLGTAIIVAQR